MESKLRQGEKLLWSGKPVYEAGVQRRSPLRPIIVMAMILVIGWVATQQIPDGALEQVAGGKLPPGAMFGLVAAFVIIFVLPRVLKAFKVDNKSRLDRHFLSQAYAITNQRVIIEIDGDTRSYGPEDIGLMKLVERNGGLKDIRFSQTIRSGLGDSNVDDPVAVERSYIGFKYLADAEAVKQKLDQWLSGHVQAAEAASEGFTSDEADAANTCVNEKLGLRFQVPASWEVQVRNKQAPHGTSFLDKEEWRAYGNGNHWNTVRIRGPFDTQVMFELFETEPTMTLKSMTKPFLVRMMIGKPVESDGNITLNGMPGFTATWKKDLIRDKQEKGQTAGISATASMSRIYGLHDGQRQLYIVCRWPQKSPELGEAAEKVVQSIKCMS